MAPPPRAPLSSRPCSGRSSIRPLKEGSTLMKARAPTTELQDALDAEGEAKRLLAAEQRELRKVAVRASQQLHKTQRQAAAVALRAEWSARSCFPDRDKVLAVTAASDEQIYALSKRLNEAMCQAFPDNRTQNTYFAMFKLLDGDQSGLISLDEFTRMVRGILGLPSSRMDDDEVLSMWRWVDDDASGLINAGEFLRLMRIGWSGFLEEQQRMMQGGGRKRQAASVMQRPNWRAASSCVEPPWADAGTAVAKAEQERLNHYYVECSRNELFERASHLKKVARRCSEERMAWEGRVSGADTPRRDRPNGGAAVLAPLGARAGNARPSTSGAPQRPSSGGSRAAPM